MIDEYRQLNERWQKLTDFISADDSAYSTLDEDERVAMAEQHRTMWSYARILLDRLNRAGVSKEALV